MKKDAYYFSHDANAMDDPKCMLLVDQLGMEGYGIFWGLIERLRQEKDYKLPTMIIPSLAKRWSASTEKVQTVVSKYGLFIMEDDGFFSERLRRSMIEKSEKASKNALKRWGGNATALQPHSDGNTSAMQNDAIKGKERKGKKKKVKENKVFVIPTVDDFKNYCKERGYSESTGVTAWHHYNNLNWHDKDGTPVTVWKNKLNNVWFKDENKVGAIKYDPTKPHLTKKVFN